MVSKGQFALREGCQKHLWTKNAFVDLANSLGKILKLDDKMVTAEDKRIDFVMVEFDVSECLCAEVDFPLGEQYFVQQRLTPSLQLSGV